MKMPEYKLAVVSGRFRSTAAVLHMASVVMGVGQKPLVRVLYDGGIGLGVPQMVKPASCPEPSLCHVNVLPAAIATLLGPVVPLYCVDPMVM